MSSELPAALFAAVVGSILLCEQFVPYQKRFFYSLAAASFLCFLSAMFQVKLNVLCGLLISATAVIFGTTLAVRYLLRLPRKRKGIVLSDSFANGWLLVYSEGKVLLVPTKEKDLRKGDIYPLYTIGKEKVLYHGM